MKKLLNILLVLGIVITVAGCNSDNQKEEGNKKDFTGEWKQSNGDKSMHAIIENDNIEVFWSSDLIFEGLFWSGSFKNPTKSGKYEFTSIGDRKVMDDELLASSESEKKFTFDNNKLTFQLSVKGNEVTIEMIPAKSINFEEVKEFNVGDQFENIIMGMTTGNQRTVLSKYENEEFIVFDIGITSKVDDLRLNYQIKGVTVSNQVIDPESVYNDELYNADLEPLHYLYDELDKGQSKPTYIAFKKLSGVTKVEIESEVGGKFIINLLPY